MFPILQDVHPPISEVGGHPCAELYPFLTRGLSQGASDSWHVIVFNKDGHSFCFKILLGTSVEMNPLIY